MVRVVAFALSLLVLALLIAPLPSGAVEPQESGTVTFTEEARRAAIQGARVWAPTNVSTMDLRLGPQGDGSVLPNAGVQGGYVEAGLSGHTRKFDCAVGPGDVVKVRYGATNGHVEGAVLATRVLWALGF